jgi:hypothetical protein
MTVLPHQTRATSLNERLKNWMRALMAMPAAKAAERTKLY